MHTLMATHTASSQHTPHKPRTDDGFWGRHVSSMLTALLAAGGWAPADLSEFFYQDDWSGPKDVGSKLLLAFGDPLQVRSGGCGCCLCIITHV